jgi:hypothetical protein
MTPEQANTCIAVMREGKTLRRFTNGGKFGAPIVPLKKFKYHCSLYPEWGERAMRLAKANAKAADALKSAIARGTTHCKYGHSLADACISPTRWIQSRDCRTCWAIRQKRPGVMSPEVAKKVETLLRKGTPISRFTKGGAETYLVSIKRSLVSASKTHT